MFCGLVYKKWIHLYGSFGDSGLKWDTLSKIVYLYFNGEEA